jgi:hypothetical protein
LIRNALNVLKDDLLVQIEELSKYEEDLFIEKNLSLVFVFK